MIPCSRGSAFAPEPQPLYLPHDPLSRGATQVHRQPAGQQVPTSSEISHDQFASVLLQPGTLGESFPAAVCVELLSQSPEISNKYKYFISACVSPENSRDKFTIVCRYF